MSEYDDSLEQYDDLPLDDPPMAVGNDRDNDPPNSGGNTQKEEEKEDDK